MLQTQVVRSATLVLLKQLMEKNYLDAFTLVGGTALALQIGHRTSTDLDFFTNEQHDFVRLLQAVKTDYSIEKESTYSFALFCYIEEVKVDFVWKPGKQLESAKELDGIRLASLQDLAAYKLEAVTNRGKYRDFFDIFCLLKFFSLKEMLGFWKKKFSQSSEFTLLRSLTYFDDAVPEPDLKYFDKTSWSDIKKRLQNDVNQYVSG